MSSADVHLAYVQKARDAFEIGADCPAAWPKRVTRKSERQGQRGPPAICGNDDTSRTTSGALTCLRRHAGDACLTGGAVDDGARDSHALFHTRASATGRVKQQRIEVASCNRPSDDAAGIPRVNGDPAGPCDQHARHRQPAPLHVRREIVPRQQRHRARVDRISAELVARKRGPVENRDADAGTREHERRDGSGRAAADDEDVGSHRPQHHRAVRSTRTPGSYTARLPGRAFRPSRGR